MKKLLVAVAAVVAVSFASCGGNAQQAEECDSTSCCDKVEECVEEVVEDTTSADSLFDEVVEDVVE